MEAEKITNYLTSFIDKAVKAGGFTAQEAASAVNALAKLHTLATEPTAVNAGDKSKKK